MKENCHNSRTNDDIEMKLGPVTKTSNKFDDNLMSTNFAVILIFPIYDKFGAIRKPDSEGVAFQWYIFVNSTLSPYTN